MKAMKSAIVLLSLLALALACLLILLSGNLISCTKPCPDCGMTRPGEWPAKTYERFYLDYYIINTYPDVVWQDLVAKSIFGDLWPEITHEEAEELIGPPDAVLEEELYDQKIYNYERDLANLQVVRTVVASEGIETIRWSLRATPKDRELRAFVHPKIMEYIDSWALPGHVDVGLIDGRGGAVAFDVEDGEVMAITWALASDTTEDTPLAD